jgi:hypothetical protein
MIIKIFIIFLIIIALLLVLGIAAVWVLGSFFKSLAKSIDRRINGEKVEAQAAPVPDRGLSDEEKALLAAEALKRSLAASKSLSDISYQTGQDMLGAVLRRYSRKDTVAELKRIRALYASLNSFLKSGDDFAYSAAMTDRVVCGFAKLLSAAEEDALVTGMMYALEAMQAKLRSTSGMADVLDDCAELREQLSALVCSLDKLSWLFLTYPEHSRKYSPLVDNMVDQVEDKISIYTNAVQYGVKSREAENFLQNAQKVLIDINGAAEGILNDILNRGIMQADVELEVLRKDIRLRGLYDK